MLDLRKDSRITLADSAGTDHSVDQWRMEVKDTLTVRAAVKLDPNKGGH